MMDPGCDPMATDYQYIAASQTNKKITGINGAGRTGDLIVAVVLIPATNSPGAVSIKDGAAGSAMQLWAGGAGGVVPNLETRAVPISLGRGIRCLSDAWYITTGANVAALVVGRFQ